jgi:AAA lid domain
VLVIFRLISSVARRQTMMSCQCDDQLAVIQRAIKKLARPKPSSRYIHDRKLPDKAIDVIDESGAAQMLLPENRRKRTIGLKEIETTIATMARIPPKAVSKDDAEVLRNLEETPQARRLRSGQSDRSAGGVDQACACRFARAGKADRLLSVLGTDRRRQD